MDTILCVDTETTGIDPAAHALIEIGAVLWSIPEASIIATWSDVIVHPSNDAESINRIPPALLSRGLDRARALVRFQHFVDRADVLVAHRAAFDAAFLPSNQPRPWVCSKFDIEWPCSKPGDSLVSVALAHGVPVFDNHRALADALLLARTFEACARRGVDITTMLERATRPRVMVQALVAYDDREKAKALGYSWEADARRWTKRVPVDDLETVRSCGGFRTLVLAAEKEAVR